MSGLGRRGSTRALPLVCLVACADCLLACADPPCEEDRTQMVGRSFTPCEGCSDPHTYQELNAKNGRLLVVKGAAFAAVLEEMARLDATTACAYAHCYEIEDPASCLGECVMNVPSCPYQCLTMQLPEGSCTHTTQLDLIRRLSPDYPDVRVFPPHPTARCSCWDVWPETGDFTARDLPQE
ncbi:MAG: hypothetical protein A2138_21035 [Deltaproteobacteria bacterium RBG_16_71_12]|nr:MAG: hypothetical protein A2138_21035 [Deltaproteobacteria bacterium RBG_16_71_12]